MKVSDVVQQAVKEITAKTKEIKSSDEEDLGQIAQSFDDLSAIADRAAGKVAAADQALGNDNDQDEDEQDEGQQDEEQAETEANQ